MSRVTGHRPVRALRFRGTRRWTALLAGLAGLVAALLLPFAPVSVNEPTVSWPRDPARPESTLLPLTAYRPLALDVRFSCDVARLAQVTGAGVVVSTALPESPQAGSTAMIVSATGDRVQVRALDRLLPRTSCDSPATPDSRPGSGSAAVGPPQWIQLRSPPAGATPRCSQAVDPPSAVVW